MVRRELALLSQEYHSVLGDYAETDCWVFIGMFLFIHAFWFIETHARQDFQTVSGRRFFREQFA
jgi:hypothetical protein